MNANEFEDHTSPDRLPADHQLQQQRRGERGQTTAEYALVLLAAGTVAMLVVAWAQDNGAVGEFLDRILEKITSLIE